MVCGAAADPVPRHRRPGDEGSWLADEFSSRGFPGERAELSWDEYESRAITWTGSVDNVAMAPSGKTNPSLVRLEGHAAFGVERQTAAIRIAAS